MKKVQLDALSQSLSRAINPTARKQEATARILEQFEPLPVVAKPVPAPSQIPTHPDSAAQDTGVNLTPVSPDTVFQLIPVSETKGYEEGKKSGYLRVPNEILESLLPTLDPFEAVVFLRLYRLSVGFNQTTCTVGMTGLMRACNISDSTCRRALRRLIELGFIRQLELINTREVKGTTYQIHTGFKLTPVSQSDRCQADTGVPLKPNKDDLDDLKHNNHHHSTADDDSAHQQKVRTAYCQITGNPWLPSDTEAYAASAVSRIPAHKVVETMHAVKQRCGSRINSFNYFVKEILNASDPHNRQFQRRALAKIMKRVRDAHIGAHHYGVADFVYDVKQACAREGVAFDNDLFNSLNS